MDFFFEVTLLLLRCHPFPKNDSILSLCEAVVGDHSILLPAGTSIATERAVQNVVHRWPGFSAGANNPLLILKQQIGHAASYPATWLDAHRRTMGV